MKPFWKSKTFWLNAAVVGATATGAVQTSDPKFAAGLAITNILLRLVTHQSIGSSTQQSPEK